MNFFTFQNFLTESNGFEWDQDHHQGNWTKTGSDCAARAVARPASSAALPAGRQRHQVTDFCWIQLMLKCLKRFSKVNWKKHQYGQKTEKHQNVKVHF